MHWDPQALFAAEQACCMQFVWKPNMFLEMTVFVNSCQHLMFWLVFLNTFNRRETQLHSEQMSNLVLNSHLDPIGDPNDVQSLST